MKSKTISIYYCAIALILLGLALVLLISCKKEAGEESVTITSTSPPVEYAIGQIDTKNPYGSDVSKKELKFIKMCISVSADTPAEDLQRLLDYFEKEKYAEYDMVQIDVFDDIDYAKKKDMDNSHLLARLRITKPNFRESIIFEIAGLTDQKSKDYIINEEHTVYLGDKGKLFDSVQQARELLKVMTETPNRAIYTLIWTCNQRVKLTYSVTQKLLIRKTEGISEETWQNMDQERIERASKGSGFGSGKTPGITYTITPYHGELGGGDAQGGD